MAIKIIIDSASDMMAEEAKALGLIHIPLTVRFGDEEYLDGVTITHREFYEKLIETDILPKTSQITPVVFEEAYEQVVSNGDTAIVITLSSKLSGTYQSARIAAQEYEGKVFVVDSENVALGERIVILRALELVKEGLSAEEIVARLDEEKKKVRVIALFDTLEYLKKGGRISGTVALVGGVLSIKPVIQVIDGEIRQVGKARGSKQGNNLLREMVKECGGVNFDKPYYFAYSGLSDDLLQKYIADCSELLEGKMDNLPISTVGATIGTYAGPGAIAVTFFEA